MIKNIRKKMKQVAVRPLDIIIVVLIILALFFSSTTAAGVDKEETKTEGSGGAEAERQQEATIPIAGITKALFETVKEARAEAAITEEAQEVQEVKTAELEPEEEEPKETQETYFSEEIPISEEYQRYFYDHAKEFGCPLSLAYGTADTETKFSFGVVGAAGEVGMMQILPGSESRYFAEIKRQCGYDPSTKEGNIACGCYLLGKYFKAYGNIECAAMAYNMGIGGARRLWARGIYSSEYSQKVASATKKWKEVLENAGIE